MRGPVRATLVTGTAVAVAGAVAAAAIGFGGDPPATTDGTAPAPSTAAVTRATLTQTQQVNGTLDYGEPVTVNGRGSGVITWLPAPGAVIRRGKPVYKADNRPVSLFYGGLPLYRPLRAGDTGDDVHEVESNLAALGHTGFTVDDTYTASTAAAVRKWQKSAGRPQTGVFDPVDVVRAPAELRVTTLSGHLGDPADGPVLAYTGTTRMVRIALDVGLQGLVKQGVSATVTLPGGKTVDGTVTTVGSVATAGQAPSDPATIAVTVTLADQSALGALDQAPVGVKLVSASVPDALTVPVAALVALSEGGYGVQVVTGAASRYVPVQLGMFANGRVQITGEGITEGTLVGVPS
ncbi:peptidoglycan-binding domain-containing protein [Catellatospora citrea]|uniref:Peptidoglycan-binding protein n=1 Tax=Catellatospora citrea TaxID=53366 RepID=A0A8J3KFN6_9ACTN|nr:peptidoglycan-binding domain-containing protein [Catellatospora citrea]RKE12179.1 putative peptidoglycan binding protein [Catellatospora citrea]GIF98857.1 peptidoglycan-binding protein [Catellatospora citrea]